MNKSNISQKGRSPLNWFTETLESNLGRQVQVAYTKILESIKSDFQQLEPYLEKLSDTSVFRRYEIARAQLVTTIDPGTGKALQVYRAIDAASATGDPTPAELVVMQTSPLYTGDAQFIVSRTGVHIQLYGNEEMANKHQQPTPR